jgi:hypothetical protein
MDALGPSDYYFITSQDLTLNQKDRILESLRPHLSDSARILALRDLNQLLAQHKEVEENHFKLWMASANVIRRIVESGVWERSDGLMEEIQDRVRLYVSSASYPPALDMLHDKNVCVLTGAPGVGKSMLADMLALTHWETGWQIVPLASHEIDRSWDVWNAERKQFFYFDDVFGQTDIQERLANDSGVTLGRLIRRIANAPRKLLVITTRTHVLHDAELRDEPVQRAGLRTRECVVQVQDYDRIQRARILYNHLYFSQLDKDLIRQFINDGIYLKIIDHDNFTPRLVEQTILQAELITDASNLGKQMLRAFDRPILLWGASFRESLTEPARWILLHLVSFPVQGAPFDELRAASIRGTTPIEFTRAVNQLEGSWIKVEGSRRAGRGNLVTFHDPSCRDFILSLLDSESAYVMQILRFATSAVQISQILGYARSTNPIQLGQTIRDATWKYPGIRSELIRNSGDLPDLIRSGWEQDSQQQNEYALETLQSLMEASVQLKLDLNQWVAERTLELNRVLSDTDSTDSWACHTLSRNLLDSGLSPSKSTEFLSCSLLLRTWWASISEASEWSSSVEFWNWLESMPGYAGTAPDESDAFADSFREWLDTELENILANATDSQDANNWAEEARDVANEYFSQETFRDLFTRFDNSVSEKWDSYEPDEDYFREERAARAISSSSSRNEDYPPLPSESQPSDESQIRAMFEQLR